MEGGFRHNRGGFGHKSRVWRQTPRADFAEAHPMKSEQHCVADPLVANLDVEVWPDAEMLANK